MFFGSTRKTCLKKIDLISCLKESSPAKSPESMLTPKCAVTHEHDLMQKLLVVEAPTGQTGMYCRSDWYATPSGKKRLGLI
jgi:hypothetical protein